MLIIFLLLILLIPAPISAQKQVPKQLTMHDAVQQALKHRPDLEALNYEIRALQSAAKSEKAGYYPTVGLSSNISQSINEKEIDSDTQLNVGQLVYSFAGPIQKYKQAKNVAQLSELEKVVQENKIRLETERAFLGAWLVQEKEKTILALRKSACEIFKRQEHRNKLEKLDKDEWLKNIADFAASMSQVDQYKDDVLITYKKLEFLMGESLAILPTSKECKKEDKPCTPSLTKLVWNCKKKCKHEPLDTYYHCALTSRPEVPQGLKRMAIQKWNVKLAQGSRLPVITANANVGCLTNPNDSIVYIPTTSPEVEPKSSGGAIKPYWGLSLSLNWSIFDGLVQQYREQQAESDKIKEMLKHEQVILDIKQQVYDAYYSLEKILKQLDEHKIKYIHGENHFKLAKQQLELGRISQVDFDAASTTWQDIQLDWLSYKVSLALAEHNLLWACGYKE